MGTARQEQSIEAAPARLPKILHRIWLGSPIPVEAERFWETWRLLHPDWELRTWTDQDLPPLRNHREYNRAGTLTSGNVWQLRSDILRYEILEQSGGVYVDCDMEPVRPLDDLLDGVDCFAAWELQDMWVNNAILGATPAHPFISRLVDELPRSIATHRAKRPNHSSGPRFLTRQHRAHPGELTVFDQHLFYPYSWAELDRGHDEFPDAYTIHHWANQRTLQGLSR